MNCLGAECPTLSAADGVGLLDAEGYATAVGICEDVSGISGINATKDTCPFALNGALERTGKTGIKFLQDAALEATIGGIR